MSSFPFFAVSKSIMENQGHSVGAGQKIVAQWIHLAGVLTPEKELQIYVDGKLAVSAEVGGLLAGDPAEAMEIGADDGSTVGDYNGPHPFTGLIDEVRVYHRALGAAEIKKHAAAADVMDHLAQTIG